MTKMKCSIKYISEYYPKVTEKLNETDLDLSEKEEVFYKLVLFFQSPEYQEFDLSILYEKLDGEDLRVALNSITIFFKKDTYLMDESETFTIVKENEMFNQKMFSEYLIENGFPTMNNKALNVYYGRNQLPEPDLIIGNKPYWSKAKVENYAERLKIEKPHLYKKDDTSL